MRLTEFLSEKVIKVPLEGTTKIEVLQEMVSLLCGGHGGLFCEAVLQTVLERERVMSTGIGQGIALPHGTTPHAMGFAAALGIASEPVEFDAIDGKPVSLVFLLVGDEQHTNTKLKALARISRLLHREEFRERLCDAALPEDAMRIIAEEESRHYI